MEVFWYLCGPDGRYPWREDGARPLDYAYFQQIARACDHLGFTGGLVATGAHDTWALSSSLIPYTDRFQFLVAVHPSLVSPVLAAKMASTVDQFSGGRLKLNIVSGDTRLMESYGVTLGHDERYAQTDEWLRIFKALMEGETLDFEGTHYTVKSGALTLPPTQRPYPPLYFGGASPAAVQVAAEHVDTYLVWGDTPAAVGEKISQVSVEAAKHERTLKYGVRLYVMVRESEDEAWAAAQALYDKMDDESVSRTLATRAGTDSVGQQISSALNNGRKPADLRDLEIHPNVWAGLGLVRNGPGAMIVGSADQVAERMEEYRAVGVDTFIISGMPLLEEAYRVGELLLPRLPITPPPPRPEPVGIRSTWNTWGQGWKR